MPDDVAVEIVDPHNTLFLLPAVLSDARRHGRPWRSAIREAVRGAAYSAIIVDGRVVSQGELPVPNQALRLVRDALGLAPPPADRSGRPCR